MQARNNTFKCNSKLSVHSLFLYVLHKPPLQNFPRPWRRRANDSRIPHPENNLPHLCVPFLTMSTPALRAPCRGNSSKVPAKFSPTWTLCSVHCPYLWWQECKHSAVSLELSYLPPHVGDLHMRAPEFTDLAHLIS